MGTFIITVNIVLLIVFVLFALNGAFLSFITLVNYRRKNTPLSVYSDDKLPKVTVQIAVYNEVYVIRRAIDSVCQLDYPRDKLEVQVVDDSTDETVNDINKCISYWQKQGIDIKMFHRTNRQEFKAGALREALAQAKGDFISVFDADFVPSKDFLRNHIHYFTDPNVGFVQSIWKHLNEHQSLLHRLQALYLDGYLGVEYFARYKLKCFFAFTGTAGTWRRKALEDSGNWQGDTLMECLDMSYIHLDGASYSS
ncbi:glycosyltransferase [Rubellicoccus peritrichatus]|uniref:Glycosyltransferase n=1 Tax=Rubellicoccus peritrichatus TaxID=3080537 RepID=A0AAQ3QV30_9BACT|nr:glycosyltransferase [Puniceicoccus sp. CR14]WOO41088.1 glycosyltransferase [Puniceicoccus sp. CR14]